MRVLHVVTVASPDANYGGPLRVAIDQSRSLMDSGHSVAILGGRQGYVITPDALDGVRAHLFRARHVLPRRVGWAGLAAPGAMVWLLRHRRDFDVVHVHLARDLVTLPIARLAVALGIPVVTQTHGMILDRHDLAAQIVDTVLTRPVFAAASVSLFLTEQERNQLTAVGRGRAELISLPNGVPMRADRGTTSEDRPAAIPEVLFLARLHPRKRAVLFVEAAIALLDAGAPATFAVVGPDEGDGPAVRALIADSGHRESLRWEGALPQEQTISRMSRADIFVLPSVDEPFPVAVLEAMSIGLPVVVTTSCGVAARLRESMSGVVVEPTLESLVEAIERLIADDRLRERIGLRAQETSRREFSIDSVTTRLNAIYSEVIT